MNWAFVAYNDTAWGRGATLQEAVKMLRKNPGVTVWSPCIVELYVHASEDPNPLMAGNSVICKPGTQKISIGYPFLIKSLLQTKP